MPASGSVCIVGAGIVGLAVARRLLEVFPGGEVTVLDKEPDVAVHQSGHNSGVLHAGIYYRPGSLKAELCRAGGQLLRDFCRDHGVPVDQCGKVVVALSDDELGPLEAIRRSAEANAVPGVRMLDAAGLRAVEPAAAGVAALHSPSTAIVDFKLVARALGREVGERGGRVLLGREVRRVGRARTSVLVEHSGGTENFDRVVVCAGLHSDRVAMLAGDERDPQIVPFRGEYYRLLPEASSLVRGLIYPVPDPRYPFLGVHFTRRIGGSVDVGPNAVLALAREGYRRRDVNLPDVAAAVTWPGFWRMAARNWRAGKRELTSSLSRRVFVRQAQRYVPSLGVDDVVPQPAGVRAQAVDRAGKLLDDFCVHHLGPVIAVRNAPSPAATSSMAIADHVCGLLTGLRR